MPNLKLTNRSLRRRFRHKRVRGKISGTIEKPRLSVFRSNRDVYAQLIDDDSGQTLVGLSSKKLKGKSKVLIAEQLGLMLAKQALAKKIKKVVFDRGGYRFAGRVKALAEGARTGGLIF